MHDYTSNISHRRNGFLLVLILLLYNEGETQAKMAKYHIFWKFLAKKHCFENKWQSTTFSRTRVSETQVPH